MKVNIKQLVQAYWRFVVVAVFVVLLAIIFVKCGGDEKNKPEAIPETDTVPAMSEVTTPDDSRTKETPVTDLQKDVYPQINELMKKYLDAKFNCDVETLKQIVNPLEGYTKERLEEERYGKEGDEGYNELEGYQVIACYTKPGLIEDTYIVWVHYEIKYVHAVTKVAGLMRLYVCTDENGVYIYNGAIEGEISAYIDDISAKADVRDLISLINQNYQEALNYDADLQRIFSRMQEAASQGSEETESSSVEE